MIGIIRHGDRTPKQKMKMIVSNEKFYELFEELRGYDTGHIKIKEPHNMQVERYIVCIQYIRTCINEGPKSRFNFS